MRKRGFTVEEAERIATELGIQWTDVLFDAEQFRKGLDVELEHGKIHAETNVTNDDPVATGKIAWAHLMERPDYYDLLQLVESGAVSTQRGPDMTVKEVADAAEDYARTVSFANTTQTPDEGRTMSEHPSFIKVAGQLYQLEEEALPSVIRVKGYEYERVTEDTEDRPEFIRVKGMLFRRDDELTLREAAKKKGKGKGKKEDKEEKGKKGKGEKGAKGKSPAKKSKGKWSSLPKGWTQKSAKSFWNSIGGSVTDCRRKLKDAKEIDNSGAFCASLKDLMEGEGWRKEPRKKKSKKASVGAPRFVTYKGIRYELES